MASIRKRNDRYHVQVRRLGFPSRTQSFSKLSDAKEWAREIERQADRQELSPNRKALERITLADLVIRYRDTVLPNNKAGHVETIMLNAFLRHPICNKTLANLTTADFAAWRDERLTATDDRKAITPKSLKRLLSPIQHMFELAVDEWVAENARILFTTQQMLEAHLKGRGSFEDIREFRYEGKPRQVRVWDEAILPSKSLTLGQYDITNLYKGLSKGGHKNLIEELKKLEKTLDEANDQAIIQMPDIDSFGLGMEEARDLFTGDDDKNAVEALWKFSGRTVRVRYDKRGNAGLHYEDVFPDDLGPLLICDASGSLRQIYRFWYSDRKGLQFLLSPGKTYSGLTIQHWNKGSGTDKYKKRAKDRYELYDGIEKTIHGIPPEEPILIVHHKEDAQRADIEKEIRERLPSSKNLRFCTWGKHTATNEYADCKHVILASVLQYNVPQYEAIGRGAKKLETEDEFDKDDFNAIRWGEIAHNIFQAACRGTVRRAEGGSCPEGCNLYMIFSSRSIPQSILTRIFPGATVRDWRPVRNEISGKRKALADILVREATTGGTELPKGKLSEELGIAKQNLNPLFNDDLTDYLKEKGIELEIDRRSVKVYSTIDSDFPFPASNGPIQVEYTLHYGR